MAPLWDSNRVLHFYPSHFLPLIDAGAPRKVPEPETQPPQFAGMGSRRNRVSEYG